MGGVALMNGAALAMLGIMYGDDCYLPMDVSGSSWWNQTADPNTGICVSELMGPSICYGMPFQRCTTDAIP